MLAQREVLDAISTRNATRKPGRVCQFAAAGKDALTYRSPNSRIMGIDDERKAARFVVTTFAQDRDGDKIRPQGVRLDNFRQNPIWFFSHQDWLIPIGSAEDPVSKELCVYVYEDRIEAVCFFDQEDPDAMKIYGKVKRRFLRMTSIGFVPLKAERLRPEDKSARDDWPNDGYLVDESELLELSICGVGSNQQALLVAKGLDMSKAKKRDAIMKKKKVAKPARKELAGMSSGSGPAGGALLKPEEKNSALDIQCVQLSKSEFPGLADAKAWLEANGLASESLAETESDWLAVQFPQEQLVPDSASKEEVSKGVTVTAGQRQVEGKAIKGFPPKKPGENDDEEGQPAAGSEDQPGQDQQAQQVKPTAPPEPAKPDPAQVNAAVVQAIVLALTSALTDAVAAMNKPAAPPAPPENLDEEEDEDEDEESQDGIYSGVQGRSANGKGKARVTTKQPDDEDSGEVDDMVKACKDAADHLADCSNHEATPSIHKDAHKYHANCLYKCLRKFVQAPGPEMQDSEEVIEGDQGAGGKSILAELRKSMHDALTKDEEVGRSLQAITGRG